MSDELRFVSEKKNLTASEITVLKSILLKQKESLIFNTKYSDDFNLDIEDRSDEIDQANADVCNAQRLRFRNRENFYEKKIDEALVRLEKCEYGYCKECEEPIRFSRLAARPTADLCIECKEESERNESGNYVARQSKSRGRLINFYPEIREGQEKRV